MNINQRSALFAIICILLFACSNAKDSRKTKVLFKKLSLTNKVLSYGPEFDSISFKVAGGCDCCYSDYLFLNDSLFLGIDYCLDGDGYYLGYYKRLPKTNYVRFINFPFAVNTEEFYENDSSYSGIFSEKIDVNITDIEITAYKKKPLFIFSNSGYGAINKDLKVKKMIQELKQSKVWDELKKQSSLLKSF